MLKALQLSMGLLTAADVAAIAAWYTFCWPRSQWLGPALCQGKSTRKIVALTFDDGPHPAFTSEVLDILASENVVATFFVCGRDVEAYPDVARRIVETGHMIGNHTYSHPYLYFQLREEIRRQVESAQEAIKQATGQECHVFRPPYGARWAGLYPELRARNIDLITWSSWPETHTTPDEIVAHTVKDLRPGAVYLLHDGVQAPGGYFTRKSGQTLDEDPAEIRVRRTIEALPGMIAKIRAQGYDFVTVGDMFGLNHAVTVPTERLPLRRT
jgi:peptidoglycan-N-acetylglucosamine deacetylase